MKLYILLQDGMPIHHPILEQNFLENLSHLEPHQYAEFIRRSQPELGVYEVYEGVRYDWVDGKVEDIHMVRPMSDQEKLAKQQEAKDWWQSINGSTQWIFNEETCRYVPPIAYPTDGKYYKWEDEINNWKEIQIE